VRRNRKSVFCSADSFHSYNNITVGFIFDHHDTFFRIGIVIKREFRIFTVLFLCSVGFSAISILNSEASASGMAATGFVFADGVAEKAGAI
jgi:hypothetical protein